MKTADFRRTVNGAASRVVGGKPTAIVDELVVKLRELETKARDLGLSGTEIGGARTRLVAAAAERWMRTRYATLELSFTDRKQYFLVGRSPDNPAVPVILRPVAVGTAPGKNETVIELPVFVTEWDGLDDWQKYYRATEHHGDDTARVRSPDAVLPPARINGQHLSKIHIGARTRYPDGITPSMFGRMRRAMAYSRLFDATLMDRGLEDATGYNSNGNEIGILWAPNDDAWVLRGQPPRPAGDPAILFRRGDTVCLLGYFDTPDEKPIDALIREFSSGKLSRKGSK